MRSFNVLYAGQLSFVECTQYHLPKIKGAKSVDAVFVKDVLFGKDLPTKTYRTDSYSVNGLDFEQSLDMFKQTVKPNTCVTINNDRYKDLSTYFKHQQLFMMIEHMKENDVVFLMTPELVFNRWAFINLKLITLVTPQHSPKAFGWVVREGHINNHFMYFNRLAVQQLQSKWKTIQYNKELYTEAIWYDVLTKCGIEIVPTNNANMSHRCLRFKPNMDYNKIKDYRYLDNQRKQWAGI